MLTFIKKYIIQHNLLIRLKFFLMNIKSFFLTSNLDFPSSKKNIYFIGVPQYQNLGDHAIAEATIEFLNYYYPDYSIIEVTIDEFCPKLPYIKKNVTNNDFFVLNGGGNIGVEYFIVELQRRVIIKCFPNNTIIVFPQTIDFGNTRFGKKQLKRSAEIYGKHNNLIICAREKYSYKIFKQYFNNKIYLIPDIVLFLNRRKQYDRHKCLMLMRNDIEKKISSQDTDYLKDVLKRFFDNIDESDTVIDSSVSIFERSKILEDFWDNVSKYQLVITDRLHGMIFAYITGTPCVVFSNYNHKVRGIYDTWLSNISNIQFCENINEFQKCLSQIDLNQKMDQIDFTDKFKILSEIINNQKVMVLSCQKNRY